MKMKCLCFQRIFSWISQKNGEFDMDTFDGGDTTAATSSSSPQKSRKSKDKNGNGFLSPNYGQRSERESTSTTVPAVGTEPNRFSQISSDKVRHMSFFRYQKFNVERENKTQTQFHISFLLFFDFLFFLRREKGLKHHITTSNMIKYLKPYRSHCPTRCQRNAVQRRTH